MCYRHRLIVLNRSAAKPVAPSHSPFYSYERSGAPLLVFLAAGLLLASFAPEALAVDLKFSGEYRVRAFDVNNFFDARSEGGCGTPAGSCDDKERFVDQRFRLTTTITAGVTSGVVTIDAPNTFGGTRSPNMLVWPGFGTGDGRFGTAGLGGSANAVGLREAYLKMALPGATLFAGRHHVVLGHSILFDDVADGLTVLFPLSEGRTQLGVSWLELGITPTANPLALDAGDRAELYLGHAQFQPSPAHAFSVYGGALRDRGPVLLNNLIYGLRNKDGTSQVPAATPLGPASGTVFLGGFTYDGRVGPSSFSFEFDALRGFIENVPVVNDTVALEGFDLMAEQRVDLGAVTVGLMFVYASGSGIDDFGESGKASTGINLTDISPNFVLGNILSNGEHVSDRDGSTLNMGGVQGGLNQGGAGLMAVKLSADGDVRPGLNVEGALIYAKTVDPVIPNIDPTDPATQCSPGTPGGTPPAHYCKMDDRLGWEFDLNVNWQVDPNLLMKIGGGMLIADNAFSGLYNNDMTNFDANPITKIFFKAIYRF